MLKFNLIVFWFSQNHYIPTGSPISGTSSDPEISWDVDRPRRGPLQVPRSPADLPVQHASLLRVDTEGQIFAQKEAGFKYSR